MTLTDPHIERLRNLVPARHTDRLSIMQKVRATFIDVPAADQLATCLRRQIEQLQPDASGQRNDVEAILVSGPSGSGKSRTLDQVVSEIPALTSGDFPMLRSLRVAAPVTLKSLAAQLLLICGRTPKSSATGARLWHEVMSALEANGVALLHLDEIQDLALSASENDRREILALLKALAISRTWPVGLLLTGTNDAVRLVDEDFQVIRRGMHVPLPRLDPAQDGAWLMNAIREFSHVANLTVAIGSEGSDDIARIMHAANYAPGQALKVAQDAIDQALKVCDAEVKMQHFAEFWQSIRNVPNRRNPFLATRWQEIDATKFAEGAAT